MVGGDSPSESSINDDDESDDLDDDIDEDDDSDGLNLAEASDISTNGHSPNGGHSISPALGEQDAEGSDEAFTPTDSEGDE